MTDIEKKALAWVNEVEENRGLARSVTVDRHRMSFDEALCRAIERIEALEATERDCRDRDYAKPLMELQVEFEAFKREVSDAVEHYLDQWRHSTPSREVFACQFGDFIIPKPGDPLVEAVNEAWGWRNPHPDVTENLRAAIEARGGRIVWEGE